MAADLAISRDSVRELSGRFAAEDFKDYRERVLMDGDIDDRRKLVELHFKNLGMDVDRKLDPLAGKTIVNVTINGAGVQLSAAPVVEVEAKEVPEPAPTVLATPAVDVDQLVGQLDEMLGVVDD